MTKHDLSLFDLWPTTLAYNPNLTKVKVDPNIKNQGHRSNSSCEIAITDRRMDIKMDTTKCIFFFVCVCNLLLFQTIAH